MIEYNYKQIQHFDKYGIIFYDGIKIIFDECQMNWAKSRGIDPEDSFCVADRNMIAEIPYFTFYTNERIKILFKRSVFPWDTKYKKAFLNIQMGLNRFGYSSYDLS